MGIPGKIVQTVTGRLVRAIERGRESNVVGSDVDRLTLKIDPVLDVAGITFTARRENTAIGGGPVQGIDIIQTRSQLGCRRQGAGIDRILQFGLDDKKPSQINGQTSEGDQHHQHQAEDDHHDTALVPTAWQ